jgi:hypothetical protein
MIWDDPFLDAMEPLLARFRDSDERRRSLWLNFAVAISPDLETCEAVLRHERIPTARLDRDAAIEYGLLPRG